MGNGEVVCLVLWIVYNAVSNRFALRYDTVSISGAIDFLQDKYALSPALQGPVISSSIIGGVGIGESVASYLGTKLSVTVVSAEGLACMCAFA